MSNRRQSTLRDLLVIGIAWSISPVVCLGADLRPNIVFILSDDHATAAVSANGGALVATPNIDRVATSGMRFDRAYVGNAICGPSRASILTGLHSHANGFYSNEWSGPFDGHQQTLPSLLQSAGYQTAIVGKWHLYSDPVGFDYWEVIDNDFEQGTYYNPSFRSTAGVEKFTGYVADIITDKALDWLQSGREEGQPFLLMYHHKTPHRDWLPGPQELKDWNDEVIVAEPDSLLRDLSGSIRARREARMSISKNMTARDVKLTMGNNLTEAQISMWELAFSGGNARYHAANLTGADDVRWKYQRYIKSYLATVTSMDRQIGKLLDYLEESDLIDNTLIVYTSDQGFFLGENGWFDKRWMDEVSSRIPLLVQWPGQIPEGQTSAALVQNIDFMPTILAAAGVEAAEPMHGINLLPLLRGDETASERDLYYHFYENPGFHGVARHYGIRTARYRLVFYHRQGQWELFDHISDPFDQINLYGSEGYEEITRDLKQRLSALRKHYGVPERDPEPPWYHNYLVRLVEWLLTWL